MDLHGTPARITSIDPGLIETEFSVKGFLAFTKISILLQQGRYAEAATEAETLLTDVPMIGVLWHRAEWALGNKAKLSAYRDSLRTTGELQQWERDYPSWFARKYAIMEEMDKSLSLLEGINAENPKYFFPTALVYAPEFDPLRAKPRFKALMKKLGLTEVFDENGQRIK